MRASKQLQQLADKVDDLAAELTEQSDGDELERAALHAYAAADQLAKAIKILRRLSG